MVHSEKMASQKSWLLKSLSELEMNGTKKK